MSYGSPYTGLLKAMIDVVRELGPSASFRSIDVTEALLRKRHWDGRPPKTPERTVNCYCSYHKDVFDHVGPDTYKLKRNWW